MIFAIERVTSYLHAGKEAGSEARASGSWHHGGEQLPGGVYWREEELLASSFTEEGGDRYDDDDDDEVTYLGSEVKAFIMINFLLRFSCYSGQLILATLRGPRPVAVENC